MSLVQGAHDTVIKIIMHKHIPWGPMYYDSSQQIKMCISHGQINYADCCHLPRTVSHDDSIRGCSNDSNVVCTFRTALISL